MRLANAALGFAIVVAVVVASDRAFAQSERQIRSAIDRGIQYLREEQLSDGSWFYEGHDVGITALATLTLIENGVPLNDSAVRRGAAFVRDNVQNVRSTYDVALSIILLSRMGDRRDRPLIRGLAERIKAGQLASGGWSYQVPFLSADELRNPALRPRPGEGYGDNSNTQFAVLALWVASRLGVRVDDTLESVEDRFRESQLSRGGWAYRRYDSDGNEVTSDTASMTCAGLFALTVAEADDIRENLAREDSGTPRSETRSLLDDDQFRLGLSRVNQFAGGIGPSSAAYFLWSIERLGVLLGLARFEEDGEDWYELGARGLLATQTPEGSWNQNHGPIANTCFALLFLRRANLGSDITRLLSGQPELIFCISSHEDRPRYETLDEAIAAAEDGDTIQIDGNGPFVLSHLVIDKQLVLQAGFGYEPVLTFEVGQGPTGLRRDPRRDEDARYMIIVRDGSLTLEGLQFWMEPPVAPPDTAWGVVHVDDGILNVLNCNFTTPGRIPSAAITLSTPEPLVVRNALLAGFAPAIDVVAEAEHTVIVYNATIYGPTGVRVASAEGAEEDACLIYVQECSIQAEELLDLGEMLGTVNVEAIGNVMRLEWVSSTMFPAAGMPERTWYGETNLFDVRRWIGRGGRLMGEVNDLASWRRFWDADEEGSITATAPFAVYRQLGNYTQSISPQDWHIEYEELTRTFGTGEVRVGTDVYLVGAGQAFSQFRDSIDYDAWRRGE